VRQQCGLMHVFACNDKVNTKTPPRTMVFHFRSWNSTILQLTLYAGMSYCRN
jgi:hypothetical protein